MLQCFVVQDFLWQPGSGRTNSQIIYHMAVWHFEIIEFFTKKTLNQWFSNFSQCVDP